MSISPKDISDLYRKMRLGSVHPKITYIVFVIALLIHTVFKVDFLRLIKSSSLNQFKNRLIPLFTFLYSEKFFFLFSFLILFLMFILDTSQVSHFTSVAQDKWGSKRSTPHNEITWNNYSAATRLGKIIWEYFTGLWILFFTTLVIFDDPSFNKHFFLHRSFIAFDFETFVFNGLLVFNLFILTTHLLNALFTINLKTTPINIKPSDMRYYIPVDSFTSNGLKTIILKSRYQSEDDYLLICKMDNNKKYIPVLTQSKNLQEIEITFNAIKAGDLQFSDFLPY